MVRHTVLLRSDGVAVACGRNHHGQCNIPPLDEGVSYLHVSAGYDHTVLLRSDGHAVCCGQNDFGQCDIPPLEPGGRVSGILCAVPNYKSHGVMEFLIFPYVGFHKWGTPKWVV